MMDWRECCAKKMAKEVGRDDPLVRSLLKSSENEMKSSDSLEMTKVTASSKMSLAYDSMREALEALALKKGYKIYNHECYASFMKEILRQSEKGDEFDSLRMLRNSVKYYAKSLEPEDSAKIIGSIKSMRKWALSVI